MMFSPARVYFEKKALDYPVGQQLLERFEYEKKEIKIIGSHNRVTGIPGKDARQAFLEAKRTLVVGVRRSKSFQTCRPSAHYQLPLATSCPGMCEYCYLFTSLGRKPYLRIYVNIEDILNRALAYINSRLPEITVFEGAATSDPVPLEQFTGNLAKAIEFFSRQEYGRFRFVTKYDEVDSLLKLEHGGQTRFRFSLNTETVIKRYERATPFLGHRLDAAKKIAEAGYPLGFIIAPIILYEEWEKEYQALFRIINQKITQYSSLTFEFITHRFTKRAKGNIQEIFPDTGLPLEEEKRRFKYGQFGYGKYLYPKEQFDYIQERMYDWVEKYFPEAEIEYFV